MSYTRSQLLARLNAGIQGRIGILVDKNETANDAVREVLNQIDVSSTLRQYSLPIRLFRTNYDYPAPSDIKSSAITDIPPQVKRTDGQWFLVSPEEFDRTKGFIKGMIALDQFNGQSILKIASTKSDQYIDLSELDGLTSGGGTWTVVGDLTSLAQDTGDYVTGSGSLTGNINAAGTTTAGIKNVALNSTDITTFMDGTGACFAYVKINDPIGITNYQLNIGSSASNYYSKVVTVQNNALALVAGWNLLRFDLSSLTTVGSPDITKITYVALFMNKSGTKISENSYKFDGIRLRKGAYYNVKYYSRYGWQNSSGSYIENSSNDSDTLVADSTEFNLYLHMAKIKAMEELKEWDVVKNLMVQWETEPDRYGVRHGMKWDYIAGNPSQQIPWTDEYYSYRNNSNDYNYDNNDNIQLR